MLPKILEALSGNPNKRKIEALTKMAVQINALEPAFEKLSDDALRAKTDEFRARLADELDGIEDQKERREVEQAVLETILPEAFATVREASKRTLGLRHYDVQLMGGISLHRKTIAEMRTGEGKTLVATLPVYLNALTGRGVHLITVNDYLARRDAKWMAPIYRALGMTVGILQTAAVTENGKKAFLYDPEKESTREDQDKLTSVDRRLAYETDITYGTNAEYGFDYLRDNMVYKPSDKVQRGHYFAIVDEVDNVLIDEARTPLIISGPASGELETYGEMAKLVRELKEEDYEINEKDRNISLTEVGTAHVEQLLGQPLRDPDRPEDVTPEQARLLGFLEQALRAQHLYKRNKEYLVQGGKVVIVDEFTGRLMAGRRWSDGLHQAVEAKEGVKVEPENITYATITLQNYFRMYQKLAGMTGTALTESEEFHKIYKLEVLPIPTNLEYNATRNDSPLIEIKGKDEEGYNVAYFAKRPPANTPRPRNDTTKAEPVFWRRTDRPDAVYRTAEAKLRSIAIEIIRSYVLGRPILVGTTSVENSERISNRLRAEPIRRLLQIQLLRTAWFEQNKKEQDGRLYPELEPLYKPVTELEPSFLRNFAKPLNASIIADEPDNLLKLLNILNLGNEHAARLKSVIQAGVPHEVLNARKHTEESQIIAGAGAFGAVTIATNMAGRGVDIKLGGEMADEITAVVSRVLHKAGLDSFEMRLEEQRQALLKMDPAEFGIYEAEVNYFLKYFDDMEAVRRLGGLQVIGSERHEARRIDNQLRGRAARQGDPGASRFYLSLEDDLMRMFGGEQVDNIMKRFRLDDDFPLENRMVSNLIEQSQHRVEGSNFDVRKHLLEYDDVLNQQRSTIYSQRDRVMVKDDLGEDVAELLIAEISSRIPVAMADKEGPWKLLAWLEQIQPSFSYGERKIYPSYAYRVLLDQLLKATTSPQAALLDIVRQAIEAEEEHVMRAIEAALAQTAENLQNQVDERFDLLDTYLEGIRDGEDEEKKRPQEVLEELNSTVHIAFRLNNEQMRQLADDPTALEESLKDQIQTSLSNSAVARLVSTIEYRLNEPLTVSKEAMAKLDWDEAADQMLVSARKMLENRLERLTGSNGQVVKDIDSLLGRVDASKLEESDLIFLLNTLARARRTGFDTRTHRQVQEEYMRFNYVYLAAHLIRDLKPMTVEDAVLDHLEQAREHLTEGWGEVEFSRLSQNAGRLSEIGPAADVLEIGDAALVSLSDEQRRTLRYELGRRRLTEIYRGILLGAITELWVDYLTRVEALRISIGLEAYAQRDPLVQYKSKASEMFQTLLAEIRSGTVSRMFLQLPRMTKVTETSADGAVESSEQNEDATARAGRKRHKKR